MYMTPPWVIFAMSGGTAATTDTTIRPDPWGATNSNFDEPCAVVREPPPPLDVPPNYARPRVLVMRQSDRAPCSGIAQVGFWMNSVGRRAA